MINQVTLVGKLVNKIETKKEENLMETAEIKLAVSRTYKNADSVYEKDIIPCVLWAGVIKSAIEYLSKDDLIGIRGRLQMKDDKIQVIVEKITLLSSKKESEENDD